MPSTTRKGLGGSLKVRIILAASMIVLMGLYEFLRRFITQDPLIIGSILAGAAAINILATFYIYAA